jgi:hypothetical protein
MVIFQALIMGAGMVNFNVRSIGGKISYFQALSILGYSMFPLLFTTVILKILTIFKIKYMAVIMIAEFAATLWSIMCKWHHMQLLGLLSSSISNPQESSWQLYPLP